MIPRLPRVLATILVYGAVVVVLLVVLVVVVAGALATSITQFAPRSRHPDDLPTILAPWQELAGLDRARPGRPRRPGARRSSPTSTSRGRAGRPLQSIAVASLGVVGTLLIVFFLSIYMVLDRDD